MRKTLFLFLAAAVAPALSQTPVWKNYTSMYDINGVVAVGSRIWGATGGGVFSYEPAGATFAEYTTTEGLSNVVATAIAVEPNGNILVGEADGSIDEMDSTGRVLRSQEDIAKSSAISRQISSLSISGDTLFACTPFAVVLISLQKFNVLDTYSHFDPAQGGIPATATAVFEGNIYVGNQFGLSYAPRSAVNLSAPDLWHLNNSFGSSGGVNCLAVFDGNLIVGTTNGLYYSGDGTNFQAAAAAPAGVVYSLSPGSGYLLVNSASGLYRMSGLNSFTAIYTGGTQLKSAAAYSDTLAAGATSRGLMLLSSSSTTVYPPGPATNTISNLAVDSSGNLWCSTNLSSDIGVGFMKFDGSRWTNYGTGNFPLLPYNQNVFRVSAVGGNDVLVGLWGSGMLLLSDSSGKYFSNGNSSLVGESNNPNYVIVGSAAADAAGNIWMTNPLSYTGNPLVVYSPQDSSWHSFHDGFSPVSGFIPIGVDAFGGVWTGDAFGQVAGTGYSGLFYYNANGTLGNTSDDQSYSLTQSNSSLLSNRVNAVLVDGEDQVWIGTDLGLDVIYDPDPTYSFSIVPIYSLEDQNINDVACDALDQKWVATSTGVYEISRDGNGTIASYNTSNSPLPSNQVLAVACDKQNGVVYFATQYGVTELKTGIESPTQSFSKLKIYPDPAFLPLSASQSIHIAGLVANSEIKVFTIDGRMVDQFQAQGGNIAYWNGTDLGGNSLPSGIYILVAYSSDGSQSAVAKIALIRRK